MSDPKIVIKKVNDVCRAYLWNVDYCNTKPGLVNWEHICRPKKEGGLGIRNLEVWNVVDIGKITWHISSLSESLWVRRVHGVYTKGGDWRLFNPPPTASWALRKLCKVKKQLHMFLNKDSYVIKDAYKEFIGTAQSVRWSRMVWLRASIPKHRYIFWLAMLGKLKIRDRLKIMGVLDDKSCPMCHVSKESIEHLFFECKLSSYCLSLLSAWLGIRFCMRKLSTIYPGSW